MDPRIRIRIHYYGKVDPRIRIHFSQMWIRGSGSGSGFTFPKCGSQDPDPRHNEMDPKRCLEQLFIIAEANLYLYFYLQLLVRSPTCPRPFGLEFSGFAPLLLSLIAFYVIYFTTELYLKLCLLLLIINLKVGEVTRCPGK